MAHEVYTSLLLPTLEMASVASSPAEDRKYSSHYHFICKFLYEYYTLHSVCNHRTLSITQRFDTFGINLKSKNGIISEPFSHCTQKGILVRYYTTAHANTQMAY